MSLQGIHTRLQQNFTCNSIQNEDNFPLSAIPTSIDHVILQNSLIEKLSNDCFIQITFFLDQSPENFKTYALTCKKWSVIIGKLRFNIQSLLITGNHSLQLLLTSFPNLRNLDFSNNTHLRPSWFAIQLPLSLRSLNLTNCSIREENLVHIGTLTSLEVLILTKCIQVKNADFVHIQHLRLTTLSINIYKIKDADLVHFQHMPLQTLSLRYGLKITDAGLVHFKHMPLKNLDLHGCYKITDASLMHIQHMSLTTLSLSHCFKITNAGLRHIQHMSLTTLILDSTKVTDAGLELLHHMPLLSLVLGYTKTTDEGRAFLPKSWSITFIN